MVLKKILPLLFIAGVSSVAYAEGDAAKINETDQVKTENMTAAAAVQAKIMYVRDDGDYYLRSNPSRSSALKGSVKAGDPVKVLDKKNYFYFIEDLKGRQRWIAVSDIQAHPSYKIQIADLKKTNEELKIKYNEVTSELQEAKKTLAAQKSQLDKVTEENSELTNKIENSEQEKQIRWAKVGALLVGFGLLAGVILVYLPRPHRRRKDIW